jgi:hypothetical protein
MSTTATELSMKTFLANFVEKIGTAYANDFNHIPADKQMESPMGVARTATIFTAECASFNRWIIKIIAGEEVVRPDEEARKAYYGSFDTGEKAVLELNSSVADLAVAIRGCDEDAMGSTVTMPWGAPMLLAEAIQMAAVHMAYHEGQLNYIQSLYGDGESHWG